MSDDQDQEPPDLDALAREYLALWQRQLADTAADETLAKSMSDAVRLMTAGAAQMAAMGAEAATRAAGQHDNTDGADDGNGLSPGTAAAGAAHRDDDGLFDKLDRRIKALEKRIAVLESEAQANRRRARGDRGGNNRR